MHEQIVVTGIGVTAPNGIGKDEFWKAIENGYSGIKPVRSFSTKTFKSKLGAEINSAKIKNFLDARKTRDFNTSSKLLCATVKQAIDDASIAISDINCDDVGICTATNWSNLKNLFAFNKDIVKNDPLLVNPALLPGTLLNAASSAASIYFNIQGFNTTISSGATASLDALKYGINLLVSDQAKHVLIAGIEEISIFIFAGLYRLGMLAGIRGEELSCPFDKRRNGIVLGEGAAVIVIEKEGCAKKRGANIYAKILAVNTSFDGRKGTGNVSKIKQWQQPMKDVLKMAKVSAKEIDYICASASSMPYADRAETEIIKQVFNRHARRIPVSSIKSMIGETFGVSGLLQIIATIGMIKGQFVAPTINYKKKDRDCDLCYVPNKAVKRKIETALINNFTLQENNSYAVIAK